MEKLVLKDLLDPKDKRGKKARGCLVSSTYGGAGQVAVEMLRLCIQVRAEDNSDRGITATGNWARKKLPSPWCFGLTLTLILQLLFYILYSIFQKSAL